MKIRIIKNKTTFKLDQFREKNKINNKKKKNIKKKKKKTPILYRRKKKLQKARLLYSLLKLARMLAKIKKMQ